MMIRGAERFAHGSGNAVDARDYDRLYEENQRPRAESAHYEKVFSAIERLPDETPEQQPVAWMTEEDPPRVASAWTREGMHAPLQRSFCIPLFRASVKARSAEETPTHAGWCALINPDPCNCSAVSG